jgi:hypothetical protein
MGVRGESAFVALALLLAGCGGKAGASDGSAQSSVFSECRGRAFTPLAVEAWRHTSTQLTLAAGDANHSAQDVIIAPGATATLPGKFAYGTLSSDLEDEDVQVFLDDCSGWRDLGAQATSSDGRVAVPLPEDIGPGAYEARFQVLGDQTTTTSTLWVLPAGTRIVITDIDGTLTASRSISLSRTPSGTGSSFTSPGDPTGSPPRRAAGSPISALASARCT